MKEGDSKKIWAAIAWNGSILQITDNNSKPTDLQFKEHFIDLLAESNNSTLEMPETGMYIPVLDDKIQPIEVDNAIKALKSNSAPGVDGIPPGVIKLLNDEWIIFMTYMFNQIFDGALEYPKEWNLAKYFTIYKIGKASDPNNYRILV